MSYGVAWRPEDNAVFISLLGHPKEIAKHFPGRSKYSIAKKQAELQKELGYITHRGAKKKGLHLVAEGKRSVRTEERPERKIPEAPMLGLMDAGLSAERVDMAKQFLRLVNKAGQLGRERGLNVDISNVINAFRQGVAG